MEEKHKDTIISDLVEQSSRPIIKAKSYWHESVLNIIRDIRTKACGMENYSHLMEAEVLYLRKLWNRELDIIYAFGKENKIPEHDEMNKIIVYIEECSTEVKDNKIYFKNGNKLDKEDLSFIERYTSIPEIEGRLRALEEDYIYLKLRDYITLNMMQFIAENRDIALKVLETNTKETIQRIADLICNFADICMYPDEE